MWPLRRGVLEPQFRNCRSLKWSKLYNLREPGVQGLEHWRPHREVGNTHESRETDTLRVFLRHRKQGDARIWDCGDVLEAHEQAAQQQTLVEAQGAPKVGKRLRRTWRPNDGLQEYIR